MMLTSSYEGLQIFKSKRVFLHALICPNSEQTEKCGKNTSACPPYKTSFEKKVLTGGDTILKPIDRGLLPLLLSAAADTDIDTCNL